MWNSIKRQLANSRAKVAKKKAMTAVELVGAGAVLTGGSILMEKMIESKTPKIQGHDNVYTADYGPILFKVESLAGQDSDTVSDIEIAGWVIFAIILMLLTIPVIGAIIRVMKTCQQWTDSYNLNCSPVKDMEDKYKVTYTPTSLPEIVESYFPSMEKVWEELFRVITLIVMDP